MDTNSELKNIINNYNKNIKTIAGKFFSTSSDIEDIEQEVYIKTWKYKAKFRGDSSLWGWMKTITVNTCKDHIKKHKKYADNTINNENKINEIKDNKVNLENSVLKRERQELIFSKINKLKPKFKDVIILHDIEEMTHEEIATKLKCPVGTVKSRLFNARKALVQELDELLSERR